AGERDRGRLHRSPEIGGEDRGDAIVTPALTELPRLPPARPGQATRIPARRYPRLVVGGRRVRLEDDLDHLLTVNTLRAEIALSDSGCGIGIVIQCRIISARWRSFVASICRGNEGGSSCTLPDVAFWWMARR